MRVLLLVDIQNDFMPGGALAVPDGDRVVPVANALMPHFGLVVATQDWHPAGHGSFASGHPGAAPGDMVQLGGVPQVLWPDHCVQGTPGASFHSALNVAGIDHVVRKGADPDVDSYSSFFDNARTRPTGLAEWCAVRGVEEVVLLGLATEYCVKYSALDALGLGLRVMVVRDGCRAVDLAEGDGDRAFVEMAAAGARVLAADGVLRLVDGGSS